MFSQRLGRKALHMNVSLGMGIFLLGLGMGALLTRVALRGQLRQVKEKMNLLLQNLRDAAQGEAMTGVRAIENFGSPISKSPVSRGD